MIQAVADTHALIWYLFNDLHLSEPAKKTFEAITVKGDQVGFSAISLAEIVYLSEKGRINPDTFDRLLSITEDQDTVLAEIPVNRTVIQAMKSIAWKDVPDLPDRIIAASALAWQVPLISRDKKIQLSAINTIW